MVAYRCVIPLIFLVLYKFYFTMGDTLMNQVKLHSQNMPKVWTEYSMYATVYCMPLTSQRDMLSYKRQMKDCIGKNFILSTSCKSSKNLLYSIEQHKEVCRIDNAYIAIGSTSIPYTNTIANSLTMNKIKLIGEECVRIKYEFHKNINIHINFHDSLFNKNIDKSRYKFHLSVLLGLNITFLTFLLTDTCVPEHPYHDENDEPGLQSFYHKDTELLYIHQSEKLPEQKLYFCSKRPKFSIYTQYLVDVDYHICKVSLTYESSIMFTCQTLDANVIKTTEDNCYRIFYGELNWTTWTLPPFMQNTELLPISAQCLFPNKCYNNIQEYKIRGEMYQRVDMENTYWE